MWRGFYCLRLQVGGLPTARREQYWTVVSFDRGA
jgi:hypothetical protein